jgi:hypothetical protein
MKIIATLIVFLSLGAVAQKGSKMESTISLGESSVKIIRQFGATNDSILFINVHEDEQTSIDAVEKYAEDRPLNFIRLAHLKSRNVSYQLNGKEYIVDPNRIFTAKGRKATLKKQSQFSYRAARAAKRLANSLLTHISHEKIIIAMHNNTDVNYTIKSYLPGGDEAENTADIHISEAWDADDFIYTTVPAYFTKFKALDLNVILQDNEQCVNDGSLSVYCGQRNIPYINIEAQKGHFDEQLKLIDMVMHALQEK